MRRHLILASILTLCVLSTAARAEEPNVLRGKVDAVTVYRGQALVTRVVDLPASSGLSEVIVSELPDRLVPSSLFAESADGVEVRSVRYRERAVPQDVRESVRKLDEQIKKLGEALAANHKMQAVLAEQRTFLDKLANFTAPTANVEMSKGVLNAEQLKNLTNYQFDSRKSIAEQELKFVNEQRDLQAQLATRERERAELTRHSSRTLREAVVFINRERAGGQLRLRYLVDAAAWTPSYNVRADSEKKSATVEYQASIQQMSGEDWGDVQMTLSTATPSLIASAPMLSPFTISLASHAPTKRYEALDYDQAKGQILQERQSAETSRGRFNHNNPLSTANPQSGGNFDANNDDLALNKLADQLQVVELLARDGRDRKDRRRSVSSETIVVNYVLRNRTSLPSRSDRQLIQIDTFGVKSQFYKVAVPVLTNYVYDEATLTNTSKTVLLAGPVSSYVGGQFVGGGEIPTVAVGQTFRVGFGVDASLRASRERLERTEVVQGGNKLVSYSYRIAIDNFSSTPANVRVLDRRPKAKDGEVKVTFIESAKQPLSQDKDYQETEQKNGILRWDVVVPPEKKGVDAFSLNYKIELEYDKNLMISSSGASTLEDIHKMMERR